MVVETSPYLNFSIDEWATFRADTPLTLTEEEVLRLRSLNDPIDLEEVERIYLSLSRLLASHVESSINLFKQRAKFLNLRGQKTPFIIGIAGSVAVGKSTTARILKELLSRWPASPKVDLITTDGFLFPNAKLRELELMDRKGFPESFDRRAILRFLSKIKAGDQRVTAPVYSHLVYDVVEGEEVAVERPDILIFEGINVLQTSELPKDGDSVPFVSDYFDFSIYIDADEAVIENWYVERFMRLRETAFRDPASFFHRYSEVSQDTALAIARDLWERINLANLHENILPTRQRADLVLHKGTNHAVDRVSLRRL
ncbi:MAG: type I pantothenate kinase [Ahrensia sp.]|nr:type I pantothenate kinase [Ahrensia sp.]